MSSAEKTDAAAMGALWQQNTQLQAELAWFREVWPYVQKIAGALRGPPIAVLKHVKALRSWLEANPKPGAGT
jgi:hypothetical protein